MAVYFEYWSHIINDRNVSIHIYRIETILNIQIS